MKGTLHTPANPPVTISLATPGFESIGNPYASAINYRLLTLTGGVQTDFFYLWDPKLTTIGPSSVWGLGGFQTFSWNSSTLVFDVTPGGGSFSGTNRLIESGQAFFVNAPFAAGTVAFAEGCKLSGSNNVNRVPRSSGKQLRTNLNVITGSDRILLDGNLVQFDNAWSDRIDIKDGIKLNNTGENLGLVRAGKTLAVERRSPVQRTDTIFYKLGQLKVQQYQFEFIPNSLQHPGLEAFLEDNYLQTSTPVSLSDTTRLMFNIINEPGSYATDRFYLVFQRSKRHLTVPDRSTVANHQNTELKLSAVNTKPGINVFPNPVKDRIIQMQFTNQPAGSYSLQLSNNLGQQVYSGSLQLNKDDEVKSLQLDPGITKGVYQLTITATNGIKTTKQVIIQ